MKNILSNIMFYAEQAERRMDRDDFSELYWEKEKQLRKQVSGFLTQNQRHLFLEYLDAAELAYDYDGKQQFLRGVSVGMQLAVECMEQWGKKQEPD